MGFTCIVAISHVDMNYINPQNTCSRRLDMIRKLTKYLLHLKKAVLFSLLKCVLQKTRIIPG